MKVVKFSKSPFVKLLFLQILFMILFTPSVSRGEISRDIVFLIDQSASMKKGDLFSHVKSTLKSYIAESAVGDRVILIGFESDAVELADVQISQTGDVTGLLTKIEGLEANGQWTYMTKALDRAARRLKDLQKAYPNRPKMIYILTDGYNDPPPPKKEAISFEEILENYFETFTQELTYVYIFSYLPEDAATKPRDNQKFLDTIKATPTTINRGKDVEKIEQLTIEPLSGLDFRYELSERQEIIDTVTFVIGYANLKSSVDLQFRFMESSLAQVHDEKSFKVIGSGKQIHIPFSFDTKNIDDSYKTEIIVTADRSGIIITPCSFNLNFTVKWISKPIDDKIIPKRDKDRKGWFVEIKKIIKPIIFVGIPIVILIAAIILWGRFKKGFDPNMIIQIESTNQEFRPFEEQKYWKQSLFVNQDVFFDSSFTIKTLKIKPGGKGSLRLILLEEREDIYFENEIIVRNKPIVVIAPSKIVVPGGEISIYVEDINDLDEDSAEEDQENG